MIRGLRGGLESQPQAGKRHWVSFGVVAVLIPTTIAGRNIGTAVVFHEGPTLLVVVNALRLLAFAEPVSEQSPAGSAGILRGNALV